MLHADARPAPVLETRRALNRSLILHLLVLGVVVVLPYLHQPPKVQEPPSIQAMLVERTVAKRPEPRPVPPVEVPPPPPAPEKIELPAPVTEAPKIALPKVEKPVEKVVAKKPEFIKPILQNQALKPLPLDAEIESLRKEARDDEMNRMRREMDATATAMRVSANQAVVDRYSAMIRQTVQSAWRRPLSARAGMVVTLRISMLATGEVVSVMAIRGSGDAAFDASAIDAVNRARKLPVPDDATVFQQNFRTFTMNFRPEDQ